MTESVSSEPAVVEVRGWWSSIADHNPFFLVSGVLMLAGCFMINGSAHDDPDVVWPVVGLVGVFNIYEFLIIALAIYLANKKRFYRDAGFLLLLEVLLLCDVSLAYNELILKNLPIALVVCSMAVAMAGMKLLMIERGLQLRTTKAGAAMLTLLIVLLFLLPTMFRELIRHEWIQEWHYYLVWWLIGALPMGMVWTQPWFRGRRKLGRCSPDRLRHWVVGLLFVLPYVSLLLHMRTAYYVDDRPFYYYNLAPVVLGLAGVWLYLRAGAWSLQRVVSLGYCAAALAVGLSLSSPREMTMPLIAPEGLVLSPLRVVLVMSAALLGYAWWRKSAWSCVPGAVVLLMLAGLGSDVQAMGKSIRSLGQRVRGVGSDLIPDTMLGWGVLAVIGSFIFLLIGAWTSLGRRTQPAENNRR